MKCLILTVSNIVYNTLLAYKNKQQQQQQQQQQSCPIIPEEDEDKTIKHLFKSKFPLRPFSRPKQQLSQRQLTSLRSLQNINNNRLNIIASPKQQQHQQQQQQHIPFRKIDLSKIIIHNNIKPQAPQIERNIESPSTSAFTLDSTKKYSNDTRTQDDFNKDRMHLLSAHLSYKPNNANTIFPSTIKRPMSNLNMGNNFEDICTHLELTRKLSSSSSNTKLFHPKPRNAHSSNPRSFDNATFKNRAESHNTSRKKFHRIKIEKGMMSTKVVDKLIRKFNYDIQAQSFKDTNSNNNNNNNNILFNSINF